MLDKVTLTAQLTTIFTNLDPNKTPAQVAEQMANAIDAFVKSGTVISNGVTSPTVPGSPATITNLQGSIS